MHPKNDWFRIRNENDVFSPSLLIYPDRIEGNIRKMIGIAGDISMLRPHVKTHKMPEVVKLQMKHGIYKFKCATIAEAEMVASCGAPDILLAIQPVGPNLRRFFSLKQKFSHSDISCIADSELIIRQLSEYAIRNDQKTGVWLDLNLGMDRTGIVPGEEAKALFKLISSLPGLKAAGIHAYDGHIHQKDISSRRQACNDTFAPVLEMKEDLIKSGSGPVNIVAGGSPTFPVHAARKDVETSPGTLLLWDYGYSSSFSDMDFLHAAVLFTRVISKPLNDMICLDLGHKAVGSEMPHPRIKICGMDDYEITGHNEEHMVVRSSQLSKLNPGDAVYAIPWHICPTVDRHDFVYTVYEAMVTGQWNVEARRRIITV